MKKLPTILLLLAGLAVTQRAEKLAPVGEVASLNPCCWRCSGAITTIRFPLEWFVGGMKSNFATLAKQHEVTKPSM